jgi:hypothetical protein
MGNYYLINSVHRWAAVCISKNACTSLKKRVLLDAGISLSGKNAIHDAVGYSAASRFLHPVTGGRPPEFKCFAVWRDPLERFESLFRHFALDGIRQHSLRYLYGKDAEAWVSFAEEHLALPPREQDEHFRRQTDYYRPGDVEEIVDISGLNLWFLAQGWGELPYANTSQIPFSLPEHLARRIRKLYEADYALNPECVRRIPA